MSSHIWIELAKELAKHAHHDQRYGNKPYTYHLNKVVTLLSNYGYDDPETQAAAWLHDIIEDTETSSYDLRIGLPNNIVQAVIFCTDSQGRNRKERISRTHARQRASIDGWIEYPDVYRWIPMAVRIKLADRISHIEHSILLDEKLYNMHLEETKAFEIALYSPNIAPKMWEKYKELVYE